MRQKREQKEMCARHVNQGARCVGSGNFLFKILVIFYFGRSAAKKSNV